MWCSSFNFRSLRNDGFTPIRSPPIAAPDGSGEGTVEAVDEPVEIVRMGLARVVGKT
jgi:hypothetical protein